MGLLESFRRKQTRREALKTGLLATGVILTASTPAAGFEQEKEQKAVLPASELEPFRVNIPGGVLDDLRQRLARTRWPDEVSGADWNYGTNLSYLRGLADYWQTKFDWRAQERLINSYTQYRAPIDGLRIHFIYERGKGPNPMPLLMLHGWPSSFLQMLKIIPLLTDPAAHGGNPEDSFDVIAPSLPGYGFSDRPTEPGVGLAHVASMFSKLMTEKLGYRKFTVHGSDIGEGITQQLGLGWPDSLTAVHLSSVFPFVAAFPPDLSPAEQQMAKDVERWRRTELGYMLLQSTKPQTLAYGLNDSPAGLAAWIVEKFRTWSDCGGDVEKRFTKDELLTTLTVYWATQTINSSVRLYYERAHDQAARSGRVEVPAGMTMPFRDMFPKPREWANRFYNVVHWTELPRGGHFLEMEEPELLAADMRAFFRGFR